MVPTGQATSPFGPCPAPGGSPETGASSSSRREPPCLDRFAPSSRRGPQPASCVGGVSLASYATTRHEGAGGGAGASSAPKVIKFHVGVQNQSFHGGAFRLYSAKVPTGNYSVSMSGVFADEAVDETGDGSCLLADKKTLVKALTSGGGTPSFKRIYSATGQDFDTTGGFSFGIYSDTNPAVHIDRAKIMFGCVFNSGGPYRIIRVPVFTLTPIKVDGRSGTRFIPAPPKADIRRLIAALR